MSLHIEDRITRLEDDRAEITKRLDKLEEQAVDTYVTPEDLADIMLCSRNHIYNLIKKGEIQIASGMGSIKRIPMSQFRMSSIMKDDTKVH